MKHLFVFISFQFPSHFSLYLTPFWFCLTKIVTHSCYSCDKTGRNTLIYTHTKKTLLQPQQILCWKKMSRPYQGIYGLHKDVWNSRTFQGLQDWANPVAGHVSFQKKKKVFHCSPDT